MPKRDSFWGSPLVWLFIGLLVGVSVGYTFYQTDLAPFLPKTGAATLREYRLEIRQATIKYSDDSVWTAWTYNGTVPGPTLIARVGDVLRVTVKNNLDIIHSFHTHLGPYPMAEDGSQANVIIGNGVDAMIAPGKEYTYKFKVDNPGIFYYHCHSADGHFMIVDHIRQGLYGAIIIYGIEETIPTMQYVIFMSEMGIKATGHPPEYIMNGMGVPGGEHVLEQLAKSQGIGAVQAQLNKTVLAYKGKVGVTTRFYIINIGDMYHSFHLHGMTLKSVYYFPGKAWPANVVQLLPGAAEAIEVTPQYEGLWLFHCHVVSHADQGMIGVFIVDK